MDAFFQRALLLTSLTFSVNQAAAEELYIGASAGLAKTDTGISNLTGTATLDEKDTGFKIFGGMKVNNNVAIELHYVNLGEISLKGNNGDRFEGEGAILQFFADNVSIVGESSNIGVSAIIGLDSTSNVNPYLRIGLQRWKAETVVTSPTGNSSISNNGTDPFFGIGLGIKLTETLALQLDAERYDVDDDDTDFLSVGLTYHFSN